jgi:hypothetical protein
MPYIKREERDLIAQGQSPQNAGQLNYLVATILVNYLKEHGISYQHFNDIIGVLECQKLEIARKMLYNYEDNKAKLNGDVY